MKVVNVCGYGGVRGATRKGVVYCGRPSALGNPCSQPGVACPVCGAIHFDYGMRQLTECRSIPCYRRWLFQRLQERDHSILRAMGQLTADSTLGCFCSPKSCHCEVIAKAWAWGKKEVLF
jgi:hypothetical protein